MPTTFNTASFTNEVINSVLGKAVHNNTMYWVHLYNGAQPASPDITPAGTNVFSTVSSGVQIGTFMSAPALGVSQLPTPRSANAVNTVSGITFARILSNYNQVGVVDCNATLAGGGGGVIVPSLSSTAGVAFQISQLSLKLPQVLGTVMLNADLVNAIVSGACITAANINAGGSASIKVYSGSAPATADALATGTLLVSFTTAASGASWGTVSGGAASLAGNLSAVASATGTAGYVRIEKGTYVLQGSVGTVSGNFILDTVAITSGNTITLTEATISLI